MKNWGIILEKVKISEFREVSENRYVMITNDEKNKFENLLIIKDIENMDINQIKKKIYALKRFFRRKSNYEEIIQNKNVICVIYTSDLENENLKSLLISLKAIFIKDKFERYNYLYDEACNFLDRMFEKNNYCDFKNDFCVAKRNCRSNRKKMGCCYHINKKDPFGEFVFCEYLGKKGCNTKCIACKLMTCDYIKVKLKLENIPYMDCFFNVFQKFIMKISFFTLKEKVLKRVMFLSL